MIQYKKAYVNFIIEVIILTLVVCTFGVLIALLLRNSMAVLMIFC